MIKKIKVNTKIYNVSNYRQPFKQICVLNILL